MHVMDLYQYLLCIVNDNMVFIIYLLAVLFSVH